MRIVELSADFKAAFSSCKREAISSFGDDKVLVEKYLTRPRHIEIQVLADTQGNCVYLFERDCSVQRRHQKVLEEAPAPGMTSERRRAMGEAAVAAAKAVGYVGAGTVEFIANQDGSFYFMEMNTRLQVEHPVTEMITGTDLVAWQLRVASGEPLPMTQDQLAINGHAIEARIYAENPEKGFLPSIGTLRHLRVPAGVEFGLGGVVQGLNVAAVAGGGAGSLPPSRPRGTGLHASAAAQAGDMSPAFPATPPLKGEGEVRPASGLVRIDSGVREGDAISPFYDPMIAKLIVWASDRETALIRMSQALAEYEIVGLASNTAFLKRLVESKPFASADLDTGLIERNQEELFPAPQPAAIDALALAAGALLDSERSCTQSSTDPWADTTGWRMNGTLRRTLDFADEAHAYPVQIAYVQNGWTIAHRDAASKMTIIGRDANGLMIKLDNETVHGNVVRDGDVFHVFAGGMHHVLNYNDPMAHAGEAEADGGRLTAPMPGKIVAVLASKGGAVEKGAPLLIMEAMKMEHTIAAPVNGVVEDVLYAVGDQVAEGAQLLVFKPD